MIEPVGHTMNSKTTKPISAAELMSRLQGDPEWVRQNAERETRHKAAAEQRREEMKPEQTPLLADLAAAGVRVGSVWDLVNAKWPYPTAIPVLTAYLQRARHPLLREGIIRALTVPEAKGRGGRVILAELKRASDEPSHSVRWALANALTVVADEGMAYEIEVLIADDKYVDVRERLIAALEKIGNR